MIGDDPDAADAVLRYIYGQGYVVPESSQTPWHFHLNLRATADKYLLPSLSKEADSCFRSAVGTEKDVDQIHNILQAIFQDFTHDDDLMKLAENLRKKHLSKLIRHPPYRAYLKTDLSLLWSHFDELSFASDLEEQRVISCAEHGLLFNGMVTGEDSQKCSICMCDTREYRYTTFRGPTSTHVKTGDQVWVAKTSGN